MDMDWYAWLRRAGLGSDLAYEYALLFARNRLGAADVRHLDHGVLATIGVAVAKHRLDILKLARKESASPSSSSSSKSVAAAITVLPWRATRLLAAAVRSLLAGCLVQGSAAARRDSAAVAPRPLLSHHLHHRGAGSPAGARRKSAPTVVCKLGSAPRKQPAFLLAHVSKPMLMLTNGGGKGKNDGATTHGATAAAGRCFASTDYDGDTDEGEEEEDMVDGGEEVRWESMFEDLNPT